MKYLLILTLSLFAALPAQAEVNAADPNLEATAGDSARTFQLGPDVSSDCACRFVAGGSFTDQQAFRPSGIAAPPAPIVGSESAQ